MVETESTLSRFLRGIPDGTRLDEEQFSLRHRFIIGSLIIQAPLLFALSRLSGTGNVTGVPFPEIPLTHGITGAGIIVVLAV